MAATISEHTLKKINEVDILQFAERMGEYPRREGKNYFVEKNEGENTASVCISPHKLNNFGNLGVWKNFAGTEGGTNVVSFYAYRKWGVSKPKGKQFTEAVEACAMIAGIPIEYTDGTVVEPSVGLIARHSSETVRNAVTGDDRKKDDTILNKYYSYMISALPLSFGHRKHLMSVRKLNDLQMEIRQYRSFIEDQKERFELTKQLKSIYGEPIGIPGFALKKGKWNYWSLVGKPGLLIPHRNIFNEVAGFQVYYDDPIKEIKLEGPYQLIQKEYDTFSVVCKVSGEILYQGNRSQLPMDLPAGRAFEKITRKYGWLMSGAIPEKGLLRGSRIADPVPYHTAIPSQYLHKWQSGQPLSTVMDTSVVWWGEGPLKGDIAADYTEQIHLQCPGVSSWRILLEPTKALKPKKVIFSFDADAQEKDSVGEAAIAAVNEARLVLTPLGIELEIALWPADRAKGLDDLFIQFLKPTMYKL